MIFLTVGTQLPFDRLVKATDAWAMRFDRDDLFAQIGPSKWRPRHMPCADILDPAEFDRRFASADAIVSHAGVGTMVSAMELGIPLLVMPRRAGLFEHRSDHQLATAKSFQNQKHILVAWDADEIPQRLAQLSAMSRRQAISKQVSPGLLSAIRNFVNAD